MWYRESMLMAQDGIVLAGLRLGHRWLWLLVAFAVVGALALGGAAAVASQDELLAVELLK
jgi:hypothetical protein